MCLSIGLLQPGDSRDVVVDVLAVLIRAKKEKKDYTSDEICKLVIEERKNNKMQMLGIAASNIRRQLKRLKDILIVEKRLNAYRIAEHGHLAEIFEEKIEKFMLQSINSRIKEYLRKIEEL
jgi:predicted transcriptional regulator